MLRRPLRTAIAALALAASALAALYLVRLELATRWLLRELEARGIPRANLRVTRLDARGLALADVALGPAFGAREIALDLDLRSGAATVRHVSLTAPRLGLDLRPGAPLLGELDAPLRLALAGISGGSGGAGLPALEVADGEIRLTQAGAEGVVELSLKLDAPGPDGLSAGRLQLATRNLEVAGVELESAALDLPFRLSAGSSAISLSWSETARAELAGLPSYLAGPIHLASERGRLDVQLGGTPEVTPDVDLTAELPAVQFGAARIPASRWRAGLEGESIRAEVTALEGRGHALLRGALEPPALHVVLEPIEFSPGGLQPVELDARLTALQEVSGRISGSADLRWSEGLLQSSRAELKLASLRFRSSGARVEGLGGSIHFSSLSPLTSAPAQTLDAAALQVGGIRFAKPHARFALGSDGLRVEEARLQLGSGTLRVEGIQLGPAVAVHELALRLTELELRELLELAAMQGVTGSGTISGTIPLRVAGESIEIHAGVLESTGPGVLRIRSERVRSALGSAGATVEQLVAALEEFHYDTLRVELEKPARGTSSARLYMLGRNPAVLDGRAFALNVNLETDLEPLLEAIAAGLKVAGEWSRPGR